ncbi:MAG: hypothetical protein A2268_10960 [Candidatus Raymondbacteria bacterium RifOxyA12_full_50_37]|nr:MAG: hypothetical protein A2268_10960 [Candidatus Raymondbacteria bacterium RifOxyA12_full_50_37]
MQKNHAKNQRWVVFSLQKNLFALPAHSVQTMVEMPMVTQLPHMPSYGRGAINLRGQIIPVLDLRLRLGLPTLADEMNGLLAQREQDHRNWLSALEQSARDGTEFKLTTDPHKCAFGKWYDTYTHENLVIASLLLKFDKPHKAIHAVAEKVKHLEHSGDTAGAQALISATKNRELSELIALFAELKKCFAEEKREIAIVVTGSEKLYALAVDSIESVGQLAEESTQDIEQIAIELREKELVTSIAKHEKSEKLILVLEPVKIFKNTY